MNLQIVAGEWLPFDQKRLSRFGPGIFFRLTQSSLLQPRRAALLMPSQRIDDFVEFQSLSIFMRMNDQIDARECLSFDQKTFTVWALHSLGCVDPTKLAAIKDSSFVHPLAKN
jgi:hypothetical protein